MKRLLVLTWILASAASASAQDITTLEKIGPVINLIKTDKTVTLNHCGAFMPQDNESLGK